MADFAFADRNIDPSREDTWPTRHMKKGAYTSVQPCLVERRSEPCFPG